ITDVEDSSVSLIGNYTPDFEWSEYRYSVNIMINGTHYFKVIAFNEYGSYTSDCIQIELRITPTGGNGELSLVLIIILSTTLPITGLIIGIILYKKIKIKRKEEVIHEE
ncbi:MAG: hypothetical protein ACFFFB_23580, partial [Candidatus Heimdallarchaeota archaeon]